MRRLAIALLLAGVMVVPGRTQTPAVLSGPTDDQIKLADVEVRRLVSLLRLEPGMSIADVGAGLGAWAVRFAQWTGTSGRVYATDIGKDGVPPEIVESEVGAVLKHVTTIPNWSPESVPDWVPKEIAPPFVAIFEKAK